MKSDPSFKITTVHSNKHTVRSYEVNWRSQMTMPAMMHLCQEIAFQHADMAGFGWNGMIEKQLFWVLSRMRMDILRYPVWNESIKISTWSVGGEGLQGYR